MKLQDGDFFKKRFFHNYDAIMTSFSTIFVEVHKYV